MTRLVLGLTPMSVYGIVLEEETSFLSATPSVTLALLHPLRRTAG